MLMGKKGEAPLWVLIEILGAFLIGYLAFEVSTAYANRTIYEKLNIAKDIALQIDTLSGITGDAYIVNSNLHGYSIRFFDDRVEVYKDDIDQLKAVRYFTKIGKAKLDKDFKTPKQVVTAKIGNEIVVSETISKLG